MTRIKADDGRGWWFTWFEPNLLLPLKNCLVKLVIFDKIMR